MESVLFRSHGEAMGGGTWKKKGELKVGQSFAPSYFSCASFSSPRPQDEDFQSSYSSLKSFHCLRFKVLHMHRNWAKILHRHKVLSCYFQPMLLFKSRRLWYGYKGMSDQHCMYWCNGLLWRRPVQQCHKLEGAEFLFVLTLNKCHLILFVTCQ